MVWYLTKRAAAVKRMVGKAVRMESFKSRTVSYGVVLAACVLVVLGDLRNLITPSGYWMLWGVVTFLGFVSAFDKMTIKLARELNVYVVGFLVLFVAFLLSSIVNFDFRTFYQAIKILCIGVVFLCVYMHSLRLAQGDYYSISAVSICVGFFVFCLTKYYLIRWHVVLDDGRQGSQLAYPGVLWKTCAFFAGFVMVGMLFDGKSKVVSVFVLMAAVYVLVMDSSRTGFMVFLLQLAFVFILSLYIRPRVTLWLCFLCLILMTVVLFFYGSSYVFLNVDSSPLVLGRFLSGDPVRVQMLADGLVQLKVCMPFGCGFGSTTTEAHGETMVVHNAFLASGGDLGVLGFVGLFVLVFSPLLVYAVRIGRYILCEHKVKQIFVYSIAAYGGSLGFALLLMLHPFSTELSEWGIWIVMTSALTVVSHQLAVNTQVERLESGV